MPRNSAGVYNRPASDVNPKVSLQTIDPIALDNEQNDIASEITNSLDRLGRSPMLAPLAMGGFRITGMAAPVAQTDTARLADVASYVPAGAIMDFAMVTPPSGWLVCDGSAVSRAAQPSLFAAIGTTWGAGDGSTTFNLPDFRGTVRRTVDAGKGLDPARTFASYQVDGFAAHTHLQNAHGHGTDEHGGHAHVQANSGAGTGAAAGSTSVSVFGASSTSTAVTGLTINNATAVNQSTGGTETTVKNYAVQTCIRT
jgi:microcystin-dependent protein